MQLLRDPGYPNLGALSYHVASMVTEDVTGVIFHWPELVTWCCITAERQGSGVLWAQEGVLWSRVW